MSNTYIWVDGFFSEYTFLAVHAENLEDARKVALEIIEVEKPSIEGFLREEYFVKMVSTVNSNEPIIIPINSGKIIDHANY